MIASCHAPLFMHVLYIWECIRGVQPAWCVHLVRLGSAAASVFWCVIVLSHAPPVGISAAHLLGHSNPRNLWNLFINNFLTNIAITALPTMLRYVVTVVRFMWAHPIISVAIAAALYWLYTSAVARWQRRQAHINYRR